MAGIQRASFSVPSEIFLAFFLFVKQHEGISGRKENKLAFETLFCWAHGNSLHSSLVLY